MNQKEIFQYYNLNIKEYNVLITYMDHIVVKHKKSGKMLYLRY